MGHLPVLARLLADDGPPVSQRTVLVVCRVCHGTGDGIDTAACVDCKGQRHFAVDRTPEGGVPDGYVEWMPPILPDFLPAREV